MDARTIVLVLVALVLAVIVVGMIVVSASVTRQIAAGARAAAVALQSAFRQATSLAFTLSQGVLRFTRGVTHAFTHALTQVANAYATIIDAASGAFAAGFTAITTGLIAAVLRIQSIGDTVFAHIANFAGGIRGAVEQMAASIVRNIALTPLHFFTVLVRQLISEILVAVDAIISVSNSVWSALSGFAAVSETALLNAINSARNIALATLQFVENIVAPALSFICNAFGIGGCNFSFT